MQAIIGGENDSMAEVVVVGSGPNGLAAAIVMAREGWPVTVVESAAAIGGGLRSAELTLPGFTHDICSAVHPLAVASPCFAELPLAEHGLHWVHAPLPLAHPFDDGTAAILARNIEETGESLGPDAETWKNLFSPLVADWEPLLAEILAPPLHLPSHPLLLARFGHTGLRSATGVAERFRGMRAAGLFAGLAAHSFLPLEKKLSAAFALVLGAAGHAVGWPFPRGGAQKIADALTSCLQGMGGEICTGRTISNLRQLRAKTVFLDVTPRQLLEIAGERFSKMYRNRLRQYRYGPGVCKVDWALAEPIPWRAEACRRAGTVHLGATLEEIAAGEGQVWAGKHARQPFVLLTQPSRFDPTRAPAGRHTGWAYCHVPSGSNEDMSAAIEAQVERFAPGFRDCILARQVRTAAGYERYNANYIGGDINGGVQDLWQCVARPVFAAHPYRTSVPGLYLCSSATPPGGGVHGMCGWHAAQAALQTLYRNA
ncbi:MAG: NAD(P)/FAD-dependent oxidoreductase [Desulfuromonadales bacterium]